MNVTRMRERAAANGRTGRNVGTIATDLGSRPGTLVSATGNGPRRSRVRYAGSGDKGYRSAWTDSPYYKTAATIDARWSA